MKILTVDNNAKKILKRWKALYKPQNIREDKLLLHEWKSYFDSEGQKDAKIPYLKFLELGDNITYQDVVNILGKELANTWIGLNCAECGSEISEAIRLGDWINIHYHYCRKCLSKASRF